VRQTFPESNPLVSLPHHSDTMDFSILNNVGHQGRSTGRPEAFISPANCRSLTLHRLCGLSRHSAAGLEPNGCQTRQEGGKAQARAQNLELLRAIASSKAFTEFERAFTEATGLPVALRPVESFQLAFRDRGNQGPFCTLMARESRSCGACLQAQAQVVGAEMEGAHTKFCYAGMCEIAVPLRVGSRLIGILRSGQVFLRKPTERQFQRTLKLLTNWGLDVDHDVLRAAYFGTRVMPRKQVAAAVKLLTIFAEHLAGLTNQILIQRENAEPLVVTRAKDFIREHHTEALRLPQVARFANASPFYFCKLFKQATGLTFTNFVSRVRIESSKGLLINPQLRVKEVAYEVGFQSLTHFNRVFQRILGQSPTEYRLSLQNGKKPV